MALIATFEYFIDESYSQRMTSSLHVSQARVSSGGDLCGPSAPQASQPESIGSGKLKRHVGDSDDGLAVGEDQGVGDGVRFGPIASLLDYHLVGDDRRRLYDLSAAVEPVGDSGNGLKACVLPPADPA